MFAVHRISREHTAEEQDFGDQERPHAQRGRIHLLFAAWRNDGVDGLLLRWAREPREPMRQPTTSSSGP